MRRRVVRAATTAIAVLAASVPTRSVCADALPDGFVRLADIDPSIRQDMRYFTANNFVGVPVTGYKAPSCILTRPAAEALARVQADLRKEGLSLRVFDCYRPIRAVGHFVQWSDDPADTRTKAVHYPNVPKSRMFADGYIAAKSGHSRGSTVDLGMGLIADEARDAVPLARRGPCTEPAPGGSPDRTLDFGTTFDCMDPLSHTASAGISDAAKASRRRLVALMARHGFANYPKEWWHFTYRPEPFPETYFDFPITPPGG